MRTSRGGGQYCDEAYVPGFYQVTPSGWWRGMRLGLGRRIYGAHVDGSGLHAQDVAIVPASRLRAALGVDQVLSDNDVELLANTVRIRLRPAA